MAVDWYNGGMEHVTRHMIYSRFWYRFLYDLGLVPVAEPYKKRTAQGLILGPDGEKMSKSRGNVVDPNDVVDEFGADVLRVYILFMGDYEKASPWSDNSVKGCKRFLDRIAGLVDMANGNGETEKITKSIHKTLKKVTEDIENMKFNTAIAAMMALVNDIYECGSLTRDELGVIARMLCPFAPHISEEIWEGLGNADLCSLAEWPVYDEAKTVDNTVEVAMQINGKLKGTISLPKDCPAADAIAAAKADERMIPFIEGKTIVKEISVPNRLSFHHGNKIKIEVIRNGSKKYHI